MSIWVYYNGDIIKMKKLIILMGAEIFKKTGKLELFSTFME